MKKKRNKLNWFMRWLYSHLLFPAQYLSFKDAGMKDLFWNIITWYNFFIFNNYYTCKVDWYISKKVSARICITNLSTWWRHKTVDFYDIPCDIIQIESDNVTYKQENGVIYEVTYDTPI